MSKFKVGDAVTYTNEYGVRFPGKTVKELDTSSANPRYFITPTDAPWVSVLETELTHARRAGDTA